MEDAFVAKIKELTWDADKIFKATPVQVFELVQAYFEAMKEQCKSYRLKMMLNKELVDPAFYQAIKIEWGIWAHSLNKIVHQRVKQHDLFVDSIKDRIAAKKLSTVFLYWCKCNDAFNIIAVPFPGATLFRLMDAFENMKETEEYFYKIKLEDFKNG